MVQTFEKKGLAMTSAQRGATTRHHWLCSSTEQAGLEIPRSCATITDTWWYAITTSTNTNESLLKKVQNSTLLLGIGRVIPPRVETTA